MLQPPQPYYWRARSEPFFHDDILKGDKEGSPPLSKGGWGTNEALLERMPPSDPRGCNFLGKKLLLLLLLELACMQLHASREVFSCSTLQLHNPLELLFLPVWG